LAGHFDAPAVGFHNGFADLQAEAAAALSARARLVGAIKTLKYVGKMCRGEMPPPFRSFGLRFIDVATLE